MDKAAMVKNLELFHDLDVVTNKAGKGSVGASVKFALADQNRRMSRFVGLMAVNGEEGDEYLIVIRHPNGTIDVVLVNRVPKTAVHIPRVHKDIDDLAQYVQGFLSSMDNTAIKKLNQSDVITAFERAIELGRDVEDLSRYVTYIKS